MAISEVKQIQILHVVSNISVRSGIMSFLMSYGRRLNNVNFNYLYFDDRNIDYSNEIKSLGGSIIKVPRPTNFFDFLAQMNMEEKKWYSKFDIVELHDPFMITFFSALKKNWGIKKLVVHAHSTRFSDSSLGEIRNRLLSIGNSFIPDYYLACSKEAGQAIFGKKFNNQGVVINNAIDCTKFYPSESKRNDIRSELGLDDQFVVGHVGNFAEPKNHRFIIDVFKEVCRHNEKAALILVGDGERRLEIENYVAESGLKDRVKFLGVRNDVNLIVRAFDCFLFPSLYEGLGISLIEAQASGVPCVFSDVIPSVANVIGYRNSTLSLNEPASNWADAVINVENNINLDAVSQVTNAGFNIDAEVPKLALLYEEMVK